MKLRKIVSIIGAISIISSVVATSVSAVKLEETVYLGPGNREIPISVISEIPTQDEIISREKPVISLKTDKIINWDQDEADKFFAGDIDTMFGYWNDGYDTYVVTVTISNVGDLAVGYKSTTQRTKQGIGVNNVILKFANHSAFYNYAVISSGALSVVADGSCGVQDGTLNFTFGTPTDTGYKYPAFGTGTVGTFIANPTITCSAVITVDPTMIEKLEVSAASVGYVLGEGTVGTYVPVTGIEVADCALGEVAPAPSKSFLASLKWGETAKAATGVAFTVTDATDAENVKTSKAWEVSFGDKTQFESLGSITVGLNVTEIPDTVDVDKLTATGALYTAAE